MEMSVDNDVVCVDESVPSPTIETSETGSKENTNEVEDELLSLYKEYFLKEPSCFIDLDKTEKDCTKKSCINPQCDSGTDFVEPPRIARSYYCVPEGRNLAICKDCLKIVLGFYEDLLDKLRRGEPVSDAKFPTGTEVIIVDDDEEDMLQKELKQKKITGFDEIQEIINEVKTALQSISLRFNIPAQMKNNLHCLQSEIKVLENKYSEIEEDINSTYESLFQSMRQLYDTYAPKREELEAVDIPFEEVKQVPVRTLQLRSDENDLIITGFHPEIGPPNLPPFGTVEKPKVKPGEKVYVMKIAVFSEWLPAIIEEVVSPPPDNAKVVEYYKVTINAGKPSAYKKDVNLQLIACYTPPAVRLPVGSRVICRYINRMKNSVKFFSGMIAEMPSHINDFRYLVFFDDGQAQYATHDSIRLVCDSKANIWDHFTAKVQQFIKRYLLTFPERAMLKVKNLDCIKTEYKGMWVNARVVEIDCSLVHLVFLSDKHSEWLYRGSTRLYPMYVGLHRRGARTRGGSYMRRNGPYVQYDVLLSDDEDNSNNDSSRPVRAVARKSSTRLPDTYEMEQRRLYDRRAAARFPPQQEDGIIEQRIPSKLVKPKSFRPHKCDSSCTDWLTTKEEDTKVLNPLVVPILHGFSRETEGPTNAISYIAPCGRRLRNIVEVMNYLTETKLKLSLDLFDFDPWVNIFNEYIVPKEMVVMEDLSYGQETIPITCVNTINRSIPTYMDYMTKRRGSEGVYLNLEPEFLVSCDCTDNCQDKSKCACWQLTISESQVFPIKDTEHDSIGYQYKRLPNIISTAIYECNSGCKCCVKTCLNRVVQHPLKLKLQLFMTKSKGWGTRCLNDIPAGTFVCVYVGNIYTEAVANEDGKMYGDEYFAELDYIEVVEQTKEGYEEYMDPEEYLINDNDKRLNGNAKNVDGEFTPANLWADATKNSAMNMRKKSAKGVHSDFSDSEDEDNFGLDDSDESDGGPQGPVNVDVSDNDSVSSTLRPSVRTYYGKDESVYIMDAKAAGNIGRYLNHSCDPNIFVQNVFVDTHDLRFPWVAFFALKYIRAGTELTWDYRYEVGSVPGKKMKCYCGSENCRGRLL